MLRKSLFTVGWLLAFVSAFAQTRPMHTYSIVARNPINGDLGVAVQSHWFSVGSLVPWAEAGVGAVATQSFVDLSYGLLGLELMRGGKTARQALEALLAVDSGRAVRQVAMIDALGTVAVHTGSGCIPAAGHESGEQFSVQANLMLNDKIWPAMATAYRQAQGELSDRMLAALDAAQAVGGDIRGKQSAAILVVSGKSTGKPWLDRKIDLRVEDHPEPLKELRRLVRIHQAYEHMKSGDLALEKRDFAGALREYSAAEALNPENIEMKYWYAIGLANSGHLDESLPLFKTVFEADRNWVELTPRLIPIDLLKVNEGELKKILSMANDTK
jgi:uncharacterized Ntn-hydrolase superfamily protein